MPTKLWKPPKLQSMSLGNVERHATWNELFYDLAFVVVISVIALDFSHTFNIAGMFKFLVLFVPVYILWISQTFYSDRFDTDDLSHQLGTLVQMIGIAGLAIFAQDALDTGFTGFVISYMIVRSIIIINNIRAGVHNPEVRDLTYGNARGFSLALAFWIFSLVLPAPFRFYSAGLGLIIDFITPYTKFRSWTRGAKGEEGLFLADISHLTERSGLFLIIVLGETIVAVVNSVTTSESSVAIPAGIIAMFIAYCIWWIFFDVNERGKDYQQDFIRNQDTIDNKKWGYFQGIFQINSTMIFAIIIIWMAVSFEHIIDKNDGVELSTLESWIFFGSIAIFVFMIATIEFPMHLTLPRIIMSGIAVIRYGIVILFLIIPLLNLITGIILSLFIVAGFLALQIIITITLEYTYYSTDTIKSNIA